MSSRGSAVIEVAAGLPEVLACPCVAEHAVEFEPTDGGPYVSLIRLPGDGTSLTDLVTGHDHGTVHLDDVNWFDDAALLTGAPGASWQAYIGLDTEQAGLWLAYTPATGLVEGSHIDHDVMIPVDWANPATRTREVQAQLARITTVRSSLTAGEVDALPRTPGSGMAVQNGGWALPGSPTVRLTQPVPPTTPANSTSDPQPGTEPAMSSPMVEPITAMLARWWAATQAGDDTGAALIISLWRADVIAAAGNRPGQ